MKIKRFGFIYFGFYISVDGLNIIEVRQAERINEYDEDKIEVLFDIDKSTQIEILTTREFTDKYKGYIYFNQSHNHFYKKLDGWLF